MVVHETLDATSVTIVKQCDNATFIEGRDFPEFEEGTNSMVRCCIIGKLEGDLMMSGHVSVTFGERLRKLSNVRVGTSP